MVERREMTSRISVWLGALIPALVAVGCNPNTTVGLGRATTMLIDPAAVKLSAGDSSKMTVQILDEAGRPLLATAQATSTVPKVASVGPDPSASPDPRITGFRVRALSAGTSYIRITGLGLSDSVKVLVP